MAKYRKISPRIWNDAKVRELSDRGKLAFLFLLTHPTTTPFGARKWKIKNDMALSADAYE